MLNPLALLLNTPRKGGFAGTDSQANKPMTKIRIKQVISGFAGFMSSTLFPSKRGGNWKDRVLADGKPGSAAVQAASWSSSFSLFPETC
jgi:hypothetical protein